MKPFVDFKEDLKLFCSKNKVDNDKISIVGVSKKKSLRDILGCMSLVLEILARIMRKNLMRSL